MVAILVMKVATFWNHVTRDWRITSFEMYGLPGGLLVTLFSLGHSNCLCCVSKEVLLYLNNDYSFIN